jgi:dephospho-CoA kinase
VSESRGEFLVVGVTGGLASGKSSLCSMLAAYGAHTIDLDQVSREITSPGGAVLKQLASAFGQNILSPSGALDRKKLGEKAFATPEGVRTLNRLTHPAIVSALKDKLEGLRASGYDGIVTVEAALIVEEGSSRGLFDVLVAVTCRDSTRRRRLSQLGDAEAAALMRRHRSQLSDHGKAAEADYAIENDGTLEDLKSRAERLWEWLLDKRQELLKHSG